MKTPDEHPLLKEILADEKLSEVRRASLDQALALIARRRRTRRAGQWISVLVLAAVGFTALVVRAPKRTEVAGFQPPQAEIKTTPRPESRVQTITDEELFALFPDRAVALVGTPGHQELVFLDAPRPN